MKRSRNSAIAAGLLTLAAVAGDAGAQQKTVFSLSPNTGPVSPNATQAIGNPGINPSRTLPNPAPRFFNQPYPIYYNAPYPVYYNASYPVYYNAPQTVFYRDGTPYYPGHLNNGYVYANFGRGYEQVSTSCSTTTGQSVSTYQRSSQQPTYYPVYYPYGPVEGSAGYPQKQYTSISTSQYVSTTCYTRDVNGSYIVRRY